MERLARFFLIFFHHSSILIPFSLLLLLLLLNLLPRAEIPKMDGPNSEPQQTDFSSHLTACLLSEHQHSSSNVLLSTLSINITHSMVAAGTEGQTLDQIPSFLQSESKDDVHALSAAYRLRSCIWGAHQWAVDGLRQRHLDPERPQLEDYLQRDDGEGLQSGGPDGGFSVSGEFLLSLHSCLDSFVLRVCPIAGALSNVKWEVCLGVLNEKALKDNRPSAIFTKKQ